MFHHWSHKVSNIQRYLADLLSLRASTSIVERTNYVHILCLNIFYNIDPRASQSLSFQRSSSVQRVRSRLREERPTFGGRRGRLQTLLRRRRTTTTANSRFDVVKNDARRGERVSKATPNVDLRREKPTWSHHEAGECDREKWSGLVPICQVKWVSDSTDSPLYTGADVVSKL